MGKGDRFERQATALQLILVDDHSIFVDGLAAWIRPSRQVKLKAVAEDLKGGKAFVDKGGFDVLLADLNLPRIGPGQALEITHFCSQVKFSREQRPSI